MSPVRDQRGAARRWREPARLALGLGLAAFGLAMLLGGWRDAAASYLAAWACLFALPVGGLPIVIVFEHLAARGPKPEDALLGTLRRLLALMPVAAGLALPVLLGFGVLDARNPGEGTQNSLAAIWYAKPFVIGRSILSLALWIRLAARFAAPPDNMPPARRQSRALLGLGLHAVLGALAADDLLTALDTPFHSILSALLLMAAWSGLALAAAILLAPLDASPARRRDDRLTPLVLLLATWAVLHVVQFVVVWSTNWPEAVGWYLARGGPTGQALGIVSGLAVSLGALYAVQSGQRQARFLAALAVLIHVFETFWFITPAARGTFAILFIDGISLLGIAALASGLAPDVVRALQRPLDPPRRAAP